MYFYLYLALVIPYNRNFTVYDFDTYTLSSSSFMDLIANPLSDGHAQLANSVAQLVKKPAPVLHQLKYLVITLTLRNTVLDETTCDSTPCGLNYEA